MVMKTGIDAAIDINIYCYIFISMTSGHKLAFYAPLVTFPTSHTIFWFGTGLGSLWKAGNEA
jgi:hypothetical protein